MVISNRLGVLKKPTISVEVTRREMMGLKWGGPEECTDDMITGGGDDEADES